MNPKKLRRIKDLNLMDLPEDNSVLKSDAKVERILFICKTPSRLDRLAIHLVKAGYPTKLLSSVKESVPYILSEKPTYIFVSWNISATPKKLIKSLNNTFNVQCIPFAEWPDRDTATSLTRSGIKDIMLYPISWQSAVRLIERRQGALTKKDEDLKNLSRIQIKSSPEDIPPDGKWVAIPGRANTWLFETDQKSKAFSKKNGRFIYQGEKIPERPHGSSKWKMDTIKGKLDFEIINIFKTRATVENSETQANLTEEQAIIKISKSLGQSLDEIDQSPKEGISEEDIFSDEVKKDQLAVEGAEADGEGEVDSISILVADSLSSGFLAEEQSRVEKQNGRDKTTSFMKEGGSEDFGIIQEGNVGRGGQVLIEGDRKHNGPTHIEGDQKQTGAKFFKGNKKHGSGGILQSDSEEKTGGVIFQERKQHDEYKATQQGVEPSSPSSSVASRSDQVVDKGDDEIEKYSAHLEGFATPLAEAVHKAHLQESTVDEKYPELVHNLQQISVITLKEKAVRGYLLVGSSQSGAANVGRLNKLSEALREGLKKLKIDESNLDTMELSVSEINFRDWATDSAQFVSFVQDGIFESVIAFVPAGQEMPELAATEANHMAAIGSDTIVPEQVISFDLYLFLEKNQKFILYVKKDDTVYSRQLQNLLNRKMQQFYIRIEHSAEYKKYCVRHFIKSKIESAKKYIKAS